MDLFYKPPLQRPDECKSLEENYLNCLFQKSLRDKVLTNRCSLDSVLWFHLECPKAVAKFDNPLEFKRKFRDFFAEIRTSQEVLTTMSDDTQSIKDQYNYVAYPEDVKERKEFRQFSDEFKQFSPVRNPEPEESYEEEELGDVDEPTPYKDTEYGKRPSVSVTKPITKEESIRKRE